MTESRVSDPELVMASQEAELKFELETPTEPSPKTVSSFGEFLFLYFIVYHFMQITF